MPNKCNWTMSEAKQWVKEHKSKSLSEILAEYEDHKSVDEIPEGIEIEEKGATQAEVKDELDYIRGLIEDVGLNKEAMDEAWELIRQVMRLAGDDIPDDIRDTVGGPSWELREIKVRDVIDYLDEYLAKVKVANEGELDKPEPNEPELNKTQIGEIIAKAVGEAIGKAQGKID